MLRRIYEKIGPVEQFKIRLSMLMLQMNAVIDERNEFMVKNLREIEGTVVGVVGALHIPGMQKIWQEAESC
jgi:uncharacterized protein YbaP (TraB family)